MGKMDIKCLHVLREVACLSKCRCARSFGSADLRVDSTNHVVQREQLSSHSDALWVNRDGIPSPAPIGATVKFHSADGQEVAQLSQRFYGFQTTEVKYRGAMCQSFNAKIVSKNHVCYNSEKGIHIKTGSSSPEEMTPEFEALQSECIDFLYDLCRKNHVDTGGLDVAQGAAVDINTSDPDSPRTRRQRGKRQKCSSVGSDGIPIYLVPSDHVTIVELEGTSLIGVFISRFWLSRLDDERNIFLFLERDTQGNLSHLHVSVLGAPTLISEPPEGTPAHASEPVCQTTGRLQDGKRFYVYRL